MIRKFLGQYFIVSSFTMIGLLFPVEFYSETKSLFLLGVITGIYNALNALGSYIWGYLIDRTRLRKEYAIILSVAGIVIGIIYHSNKLIAYELSGFVSALDGPIYSAILLETTPQEKLVLGNTRLSQISLAGNVTGSLLSAFYHNDYLILIFFSISLIFNVTHVPRYDGGINYDVVDRNKILKALYVPIISYFWFNMAAEIFYTLYVPLNYLMLNPSYIIFLSYSLLYLIEEVIYSKGTSLVKGKEEYFMLLVTFARSLIVLYIVYIILIGFKIYEGTMLLFLTFGPLFPIYNISFFSLMIKGLKRNKATVIGIFNATEDIANVVGGFLSGSTNNIVSGYQISFYSFALSLFLLYIYLRKPLLNRASS
ncbi:MFS transporter [Sulfolobus tengchongensis]|uniref:MFS transporter n=1 Tax=Sulfolobus tengchongensis TaxID=207809 RepID=A0AAX4L2J7_9CREN